MKRESLDVRLGKNKVVKAVVGVFCLWVIGAILFPVLTQNNGGRNPCFSNLKRMGMAIMMYEGDHDDRAPLEPWMDATQGYVKDDGAYTCPTLAAEKKQYGYAMNLDALGKKPKESDIVLFETDTLGPNVVANLAARARSRHGEGSNVGYGDAHAKFWKGAADP